jgi:hypothetical protein
MFLRWNFIDWVSSTAVDEVCRLFCDAKCGMMRCNNRTLLHFVRILRNKDSSQW